MREATVRDVLMEIVQEDVDKRVNERVNAKERETLAFSIKKMMANLKLTLEQAMDVLSIPQSQRQTYASLV